MKYFLKKHMTFIMFSICFSIVLIQIVYGIYENTFTKNKGEKIIAHVDTYNYFNIIKPSFETLEKLDKLENILPTKSNSKNYKSFIYELLNGSLDLEDIRI